MIYAGTVQYRVMSGLFFFFFFFSQLTEQNRQTLFQPVAGNVNIYPVDLIYTNRNKGRQGKQAGRSILWLYVRLERVRTKADG
jgi:hypothetical protein